MQSNNLYKNLSKVNTASMIFHLFNRHDQMASSYQEIADDLDEKDNLKAWFSSLADFRQSLADELRTIVKDIGEVPVKPSEDMKPYLHNRDEDIIRLINQGNRLGLIELSLEAEEDVSKHYQKVAGNKEVPLQIREKLEKQHSRLMEVIRKADRLRTVPEQDNIGFKV